MKKDHKKVTLIIEGVYPWFISGVSQWLYRYFDYFSDIQFQVIQIATDPFKHPDFKKADYPLGQNIINFIRVIPPKITKLSHSEEDLKKWTKTLRLPDLAATDLIHVVNTGLAGWLGSFLSKRFNKPLYLTYFESYVRQISVGATTIANGYKLSLLGLNSEEYLPFFEALESEIVRQSNFISCTNLKDSERLKEQNPNTFYLPNGVDETWLITSKLKKYDADHLIIGWIGHCTWQKNPLKFFELIDAFRRWKTNTATFIMLLLESGEFDLTEKVLDKAQDYPELELIWNKQTSTVIEKLDAVCYTGFYEAFPLSLVESGAKKVLPFGWNCGDLPNDLGNFEHEDAMPETVAYHILSLRRRKPQWDKVVEELHKKIEEQYLWKHIFMEYKKNLFRFMKWQ